MSEPIPEPPVPYGGCLWPADPACFSSEWDAMDAGLRARALALASSALRGLTAYRVGGCPVTVRPCAPRGYIAAFVPFYGSYGSDWMQPGINTSGHWVNSCGCSGGCGCSITGSITLPAPIGEIVEIKVDGNIIPEADYAIVNGNAVVWIGAGPSPFPASQNLSLPDTEPGTFSITYLNAYPVDGIGAQAAALLAMEFAKACKPKGKCALPRGVTEVVRNGVSFTIEAGMFPNGSTGIDIVDAFIEQWNPEHRKMPTKVWTPQSARTVRY